MSFDLALSKGDLSIGSDGDLAKVQNTSKLVQDVLKILHTPLGANPYFPNLGSPITTLDIGMNMNQQFLESRVENSLRSVIQTMQNIQRKQALIQVVSPSEVIQQIVEIRAAQDQDEPRQFNIFIQVLSGDTTTVRLPSFSLSTSIGGENS
jgi:phage baseplate assembly protein W